VRVFQRLAVGVAENLRDQEADHRGDAVAVKLQILEAGVTRDIEIHLHAVDDFKEMLALHVEGFDMRQQCARDRMLRIARVHLVDFIAPPI